MINIGIHEYFRIFVPAIIFVSLLKAFMPGQFPDDSGQIILVSAWVGILFSPIADKLAKRWFHRQTIRTGFYESLVKSFSNRVKIDLDGKGTKHISSFSGETRISENKETQTIIEAYKIFSRQGWGGEADAYRIRTEKSFGILYYSLFCYLVLTLFMVTSNELLNLKKIQYMTGYWFIDISLLMLAMIILFWEATARFRMSLNNELLVLEAHFGILRELYDRILDCGPEGSASQKVNDITR